MFEAVCGCAPATEQRSFLTGQGVLMPHVVKNVMSDLQLIETTLERAARRRRRERAFRGLWRGLVVGACFWLLTAGGLQTFCPCRFGFWARRDWSRWRRLCWAWWSAAGAKIPLNDTARWVDGRQKLQERPRAPRWNWPKAESNTGETWRRLLVTRCRRAGQGVGPAQSGAIPSANPQAAGRCWCWRWPQAWDLCRSPAPRITCKNRLIKKS